MQKGFPGSLGSNCVSSGSRGVRATLGMPGTRYPPFRSAVHDNLHREKSFPCRGPRQELLAEFLPLDVQLAVFLGLDIDANGVVRCAQVEWLVFPHVLRSTDDILIPAHDGDDHLGPARPRLLQLQDPHYLLVGDIASAPRVVVSFFHFIWKLAGNWLVLSYRRQLPNHVRSFLEGRGQVAHGTDAAVGVSFLFTAGLPKRILEDFRISS
jgi:hypothetical protein